MLGRWNIHFPSCESWISRTINSLETCKPILIIILNHDEFRSKCWFEYKFDRWFILWCFCDVNYQRNKDRGEKYPLYLPKYIFIKQQVQRRSSRGHWRVYITPLLSLSHNRLIGGIPSLGKMGNLKSLDFSSNQLIGTISRQLIDLTFMSILNLSENHLSGTIPRRRQFDNFVMIHFLVTLHCVDFLWEISAMSCQHKNQKLMTMTWGLVWRENDANSLSNEIGVWIVPRIHCFHNFKTYLVG